MSTIRLSNGSPSSAKVDALVIGVTPGAKGAKGIKLAPGAKAVNAAFNEKLTAALVSLGATGKAGEITKIATLGAISAPLLVAVGLGDGPAKRATGGTAEDAELETLRRAAGAAARALAGTAKVGLALPAADGAQLAALAEGALLGAYAFRRYRTTSGTDGKAGEKAPVEAFTLLTDVTTGKDTKAAIARSEVISAAVHRCRDLVNTPPCDLYPEQFAAAAVDMADGLDLKVEVLDDAALRKGGYGGIMGVGQGSTRPPRLVQVSYKHPKATKHLALVGKGITFDSGGISLKPSASMETMKSDMGGAAAVICALTAIAQLGLEVNVTGWAPMAENMPSGAASRPSDVLKMYGGKTVEVLNTDAEGRLILGDTIARASEDSPDVIVDVATLTGSQVVALGARTSAIMSTDDDLRTKLHEASARAGEAMWPMPLPPELRKSMDSEVADISNVGDRYGGMMVAGLFLSEFVGNGIRWAHLDIAGPAFESGEPYGYTHKGGTGASVRTLVRLAEDLAAGTL